MTPIVFIVDRSGKQRNVNTLKPTRMLSNREWTALASSCLLLLTFCTIRNG